MTEKENVKNAVIDVLETLIKAFKEDDIKTINNIIEFSPAGDGYGEDNYFIDFNYNYKVRPYIQSSRGCIVDNSMDISDVLFCIEDGNEEINNGK